MLATAEPGQERIASEKPSYRKLFFRGPGRLLRVRVVSAGSTPGAVHDAEVLAGAGASSRIARLVPQSEFVTCVRVRLPAFGSFAFASSLRSSRSLGQCPNLRSRPAFAACMSSPAPCRRSRGVHHLRPLCILSSR